MTASYRLSDRQEAYAQELVASGRYGSVEEVVQEALQRLREDDQPTVHDIDGLRQAWQDGVDSGDYKPADETFDRLEAKYRAMAAGPGA